MGQKGSLDPFNNKAKTIKSNILCTNPVDPGEVQARLGMYDPVKDRQVPRAVAPSPIYGDIQPLSPAATLTLDEVKAKSGKP